MTAAGGESREHCNLYVTTAEVTKRDFIAAATPSARYGARGVAVNVTRADPLQLCDHPAAIEKNVHDSRSRREKRVESSIRVVN